MADNPEFRDPNEWRCQNCDMLWTWPFCGACGRPAPIKVQQPVDVSEARSHLGAALSMVIESDERAIVDHIKAAYLHLGGKL